MGSLIGSSERTTHENIYGLLNGMPLGLEDRKINLATQLDLFVLK